MRPFAKFKKRSNILKVVIYGTILKNNKIDDINITIKSDTKITAQDLGKIKSSGKTVKFNYYNDDKSLVDRKSVV